MLVGWQDSLATGNDLIDSQHKELFRRVEGLVAACQSGKGREEVKRLLNFLRDYVATHFAAEERLQQQYRFPDYRNHKEQHEAFTAKLASLEKELLAEGLTISLVVATNKIVFEWLSNHINKMDKALASYLRSVGETSS